MIEKIGYILVCFFIVYLALQGLFGYLEDNFGITITTGEEIFISQNEGQDWETLKSPVKQGLSAKTLVFDPENPYHLYLASAKGIFQSKNQGKKFRSQRTVFNTQTKPSVVSECIFDPQRPNTIYIVCKQIGGDKLLVSNDGGENFRTIFVSEKEDRITAFAIDPFSSQFLYIGTKKGLFLESKDFGSSWRKKIQFSQEISQIAPDPYKEGEIYVVLAPVEKNPFDYWSFRIPGKLMITKNRGEDFREFEKIKEFDIKKVVFDPNIKGQVYFVSDSYLLRTSPGEKIEIVKDLSSSDAKITAFTIDPKNSNILYLGTENVIYRSENKGEDWEVIEPPIKGRVQEIKINPSDPKVILLSIRKTL